MGATAATPIRLNETTRIQEGSILPATKEIVVTVIKRGFGNKKGNRYYSTELLTKSAPMFENARMYADHLNEKQEKELGGAPRSVRDLVGRITESWYDAATDSVKAKVKICRDWFWEIVTSDPQAVEVSIDAIGTARNGMAEGRQARVVESFHRVRSVDFVTLAGAGGGIDSILEAQQEDILMLDTISLADLKKHRPDLLEEITKEAGVAGNPAPKAEVTQESSNEGKDTVNLAEAIKEAVTEAIAEARTEIEANADKRVTLVENRTIVKSMLQEAKLPEVSTNSIYESFHDNCMFEADGDKDASTVLRERVKEAIDNKKAEIREWMPKAGGISGMGPSAAMLEAGDEGNATIATPMHDNLLASLDLGTPSKGGD